MLERQIANSAAQMLKDHAAIMDVLEAAHLESSHASAIIDTAEVFRARLLADDKRETALTSLVERIELQAGAARLTLALRPLLPEQPAAKDLTLTQSIPLQISRRGVGSKLILDGSDDAAPPDVNAALLRLAARSRAWFAALATGAARSVAELAVRDGLGERYVSSLLPLAFLAPSILEAAAQGRLPAGFPLSAMTNRPHIPIAWHDQLRAFGIR
jgi:hypothetical protein